MLDVLQYCFTRPIQQYFNRVSLSVLVARNHMCWHVEYEETLDMAPRGQYCGSDTCPQRRPFCIHHQTEKIRNCHKYELLCCHTYNTAFFDFILLLSDIPHLTLLRNYGQLSTKSTPHRIIKKQNRNSRQLNSYVVSREAYLVAEILRLRCASLRMTNG